MHFRVARLFAVACTVIALGGCDMGTPLAPAAGEALLAAGGLGSGAPSTLTSAAVSATQIDLTWQDNSSNETGFEVHRSTTGPSGTFAHVASTDANVASYSDHGLGSRAEYCYKARAFRRTEKSTTFSAFSNTSCSTTPSATPAPASSTSAEPLNSRDVTLTWTDNSANEGGFRVERSSDDGASWALVVQASPNQTRTFDFGRNPESPQLCYRVVAFNGDGDSPPSNTDCTTPPAGPTTLTASVADQAIVLSWADNSAVEDGYEVQRAPSGGAYTVVANLPANATEYRDSQVSVDVTYWYYVRAKKDGGFSDQSNVAHAVVATGPPTAASGAGAAASSTTTIDVTWTDNSVTEDGFRIERSEDGGGSWTTAGTVGTNQRWFSDGGRAAEQPVCYRVLAFNGKGDAAPSNADCTSTTTGPTDLTATVVDPLTVDLAWTDNSGSEDGYVVERIHPAQDSYWVIAELPPNSTTYRDADLWFGPDQYAYRVVAKKDGGLSDYSDEVLVNTSAPSPASAAAAASERRISPSVPRTRPSASPARRPSRSRRRP